MWLYAEIGENNVVLNVILIKPEHGNDENDGQAFCQALTESENRFIKGNATFRHFPDNQIRKNPPIPGALYDETRDAFIYPSPWPSWVLNEETCQHEPPVEKPADTETEHYWWDESTTSWKIIDWDDSNRPTERKKSAAEKAGEKQT
jgi:hypothetical protein